uniref:WxxW domain-containing protein n=1 Tax=Cyprinus carpio TaxID=7962 RepID=A0A8C1TTA6_CYPCA
TFTFTEIMLEDVLFFCRYDPTQGFACVNQPLQRWCWWFDFDDPTRGGDFELLTTLQQNYPGEICPNPIGIQAQTVSGISISASGFFCKYVKPGFCADYKVRFTCPDEWCSKGEKILKKCRTPWLDRDDPSGVGDYETLSLLLIRYPLQVCPKPIAIEVTTISGTPALPPGNIFVVYVSGFACVNAGQTGGGVCDDYKVRFSCPETFCSSE